MEKLVIATRGSRLALWQANHVKDSLEAVHPGLAVELNIIKTKGDIILDVPLAKVGGKGLFVKEIEEALLSGAADIAVHSMKDVPMELPEGLILGIVPEREDPTDLFLSVDYDSLENLPAGAVVGTSSLRRQAQVLAQRPDLEVVSLRGNVDTRLRKLTEGQFAAIIMATAGMKCPRSARSPRPRSSPPWGRARSASNSARTARISPKCCLSWNTVRPASAWKPNAACSPGSTAAVRFPSPDMRKCLTTAPSNWKAWSVKWTAR